MQSYLSNLARRLNFLAYLVENPSLFSLRHEGGDFLLYRKLTQHWLQDIEFRTILDIGANKGQFALTAAKAFPIANIYSFEPIFDCYQILIEKMDKTDNFHAFNIALGDYYGEIDFERNEFTASSSLLKLADEHKKNFPSATKTETVKVKIDRLDNFLNKISLEPPILMKIDVQGYEDKVILGGEMVLKKAQLVLIETSFRSLYESQPIFDTIYSQMNKLGFKYIGSLDQMISPIDGSILYADSLFQRIT